MIINKSHSISIRILIKILKENKYSNLIKKKEYELNKEKKRELRYFKSVKLTTQE